MFYRLMPLHTCKYSFGIVNRVDMAPIANLVDSLHLSNFFAVQFVFGEILVTYQYCRWTYVKSIMFFHFNCTYLTNMNLLIFPKILLNLVNQITAFKTLLKIFALEKTLWSYLAITAEHVFLCCLWE